MCPDTSGVKPTGDETSTHLRDGRRRIVRRCMSIAADPVRPDCHPHVHRSRRQGLRAAVLRGAATIGDIRSDRMWRA